MKMLLIEDNPDHADLLMDCIQQAFQGTGDITWYTELLPALELLQKPVKEQRPDICFCDLQLADSSIQDTVVSLTTLESPVPVVVLTSLYDEDRARSLIESGIQDYITKDDLKPNHLFKACTYAIERQRQTVLLAEKNRDQAAFCYSLSHDFKDPIGRIGAHLQSLRDDLKKRVELNDNEIEHFAALEHDVAVIDTLVGELYQYLSLENKRDNFAEVDLNDVVEEARRLVVTEKDTSNIVLSPLPTVEGNRAQLVILFKNLLDNSVKFCVGDPIIHLRSESNKDSCYALISVRDNGVGMEADKVGTIFTPFERVHSDDFSAGTGLGLSIVKRIVDNHNGYIHVDSAPQIGTTLLLTIPYRQQALP